MAFKSLQKGEERSLNIHDTLGHLDRNLIISNLDVEMSETFFRQVNNCHPLRRWGSAQVTWGSLAVSGGYRLIRRFGSDICSHLSCRPLTTRYDNAGVLATLCPSEIPKRDNLYLPQLSDPKTVQNPNEPATNGLTEGNTSGGPWVLGSLSIQPPSQSCLQQTCIFSLLLGEAGLRSDEPLDHSDTFVGLTPSSGLCDAHGRLAGERKKSSAGSDMSPKK